MKAKVKKVKKTDAMMICPCCGSAVMQASSAVLLTFPPQIRYTCPVCNKAILKMIN